MVSAANPSIVCAPVPAASRAPEVIASPDAGPVSVMPVAESSTSELIAVAVLVSAAAGFVAKRTLSVETPPRALNAASSVTYSAVVRTRKLARGALVAALASITNELP